MVRPTTPSAGPLPEALARLTAAGLAEDLEQLLDALWLACHLPAPAPAEAPQPAGRPDTTLAALALAQSPRTGPPPEPGRNAAPEVEVALQRAATDLPPAAQGLYAHAGPGPAEDDVRARALRVAGVPALRDGPALARALRPLGKRRPSRTRFVLDEAATAEHFADTGLLMPMLVGERERFLAATLLVKDSPALPLWRGLADELEALLARQGGFRSFRRLALASVDGRLHLRSRSGALHPPRMLLEDDASLVLIATDGTPSAWSDGRMAALATELGRRTALAVLQWMPERLWPHTALGSADLGVQSPRPGAPLAELRVQRPRWLGRHEPVLPMPVAALTPAALGRLAAMLMAKPGARSPAGLLWLAPPADDEAPADEPDEALDDLTPAQRIARFRGMASARLLQAAVQLSAAAPLTLPVVRLVHRVMQPGAPAEDLPLLLLGGLLERQPRPAGTAAPSGHKDDDNDVTFDFAPGVRQALQASLLKHEADAVRRAVSSYIAERQGSPVDFTALLLDPEGALRLPAWARPFAEVNRQLQALFAPPPSAAEPPPLRLRERAWAPGVTVQAEVTLPSPARQIAWSPDSRRLAVRHGHGVVVLRRGRHASGQQGLVREALAMKGPSQVLVIQGFDMAEDARQALIEGFQAQWPVRFRGGLQLQFHTVGPEYDRDLRRQPGADMRRMVSIAVRQQALVLCLGGPRFQASAWVRAAEAEFRRQLDLTVRQPVISIEALARPADAQQRTAWRIRRMFSGEMMARLQDTTAASMGQLLATLLADDGARSLSQVAFGTRIGSLLWDERQHLLVLDETRRAVVDEADLSVVEDLSPRFTDQPALMALQPGGSGLTLARGRDLFVDLPAYASMQAHADGMEAPIVAMAWSASGAHLALRLANGTLRLLWTQSQPSAPVTLPDLPGVAAGPVWSRASERLAVAMADGSVQVRPLTDPLLEWKTPEAVHTLDWSHDDGLLACGLAGGRVQLVQGVAEGRPRIASFTPPEGDGTAAQLAFVPRPLDSGYQAVALASGHRLHLLRIDITQLQSAAAEQPDNVAPPIEWPEPDDLVHAACAVLQSLSLAFHVGRMAPADDAPTLERYARMLSLPEGSSGWGTLQQLWRHAEYLYSGPVRHALEEGGDPLARPDTDAGAGRWRDELQRLAQALDALLQGSSRPEDPDALAQPLADVQRWLRLLQAWLDDSGSPADTPALDQALGQPAGQWLASMTPLRDSGRPGESPRPVPLPARLPALMPLLQRLHTLLPALQSGPLAEPVAHELAAPVARVAWLRTDQGASAFSGSRHLSDYAGRFAASLAQTCESLLDAAPPTPPLQVGFSVPAETLAAVQALAEPLALRLQAQPAQEGRCDWSMPPADVAPLIRLLGAIVATRLAWQSYLPPPEDWAVPGLLLLWVDDRPDNNLGAVHELLQRGFRVRTALHTEAALALLASDLPVQAVISDMGRPPDEQAGYTLLDEMRQRGHSQPFLIFSRAPRPEHQEEAVRRGAVGTTDDFEVILGWLQREFLQRPAIKRAA